MQEAKILSKLQVGLMISRTMLWVSGMDGISLTSHKIPKDFMSSLIKMKENTIVSTELRELFRNYLWNITISLKILKVFQSNRLLWWDYWSTSLVTCINLCTMSICTTTLTLMVILVETKRNSCFSITLWWSFTLTSTVVLFVLTHSTALSISKTIHIFKKWLRAIVKSSLAATSARESTSPLLMTGLKNLLTLLTTLSILTFKKLMWSLLNSMPWLTQWSRNSLLLVDIDLPTSFSVFSTLLSTLQAQLLSHRFKMQLAHQSLMPAKAKNNQINSV